MYSIDDFIDGEIIKVEALNKWLNETPLLTIKPNFAYTGFKQKLNELFGV